MNEDQFRQDRIVYGGALNYQGVGVNTVQGVSIKDGTGMQFLFDTTDLQ